MIFIKKYIPFGTIFIILSVLGCSSEALPDGQAKAIKANDISVYFQSARGGRGFDSPPLGAF
ncbi:MAG TPA: hypothetical protein PK874_13495, partial [Desulfobacteraceae bacterium]|nr:hypothetical protein [Desulfobacteraceae bacterium]